KDMKFPQDYFYRFGGAYSDLIKSRGQLSFAVGVTILLIYMILACLFQSYLQPLIIMAAVPLAAVGIYAGLKVTGKPLSEHVFIGMIILAGSVVKNSVVMMDHYNSLKPLIRDHRELLIRSGEDRMRPILMTSIATILGFVPMAIGIGQSSDLWSPLAITMIGGLTSSTILTLIIIPNILLALEDVKRFFSWLRAQSELIQAKIYANSSLVRSYIGHEPGVKLH
ncbi:MAG TPA: efflux RND transporter permease subunit, partial [Candidatus Omnitrophota bacterium]|nr:efflux RND transporter permease subunit [Candidatus Omnitrophota bacterium]